MKSKTKKSNFFKQSTLILVCTVIYLIGALFAAFIFDNKEFLFYVAAAPFIVSGVAYFHQKINFPIDLLWALCLLGFLHILGGFVPLPKDVPAEGQQLLYNLWLIPDRLKFDQVVHAYGNGVATLLCWHLLRYSMSHILKCEVLNIPARPIFLLICFLAGMGVGAFNEVGEFGTSQLVEDNNVGGYVNTGWDLVANMVGGFAAIFWIWLDRRHGRIISDKTSKVS